MAAAIGTNRQVFPNSEAATPANFFNIGAGVKCATAALTKAADQ